MHDTHNPTRAIAPITAASLIPEVLPTHQNATLVQSGGVTYRIERVEERDRFNGNGLWLLILGILISMFGLLVVSLLLAIALKPTPERNNPICLLNCNASKEINSYAQWNDSAHDRRNSREDLNG